MDGIKRKNEGDSTEYKAFQCTDRLLRQVLEKLYATSDLISIQELVDSINCAVLIEFDFIIYIREKRWFGHKIDKAEENFLKFNFISFEKNGQKCQRFSSLVELESREQELLESGYILFDKPLCRILYKSTKSFDLERILNLIIRIMVAFYRNCGSFDHFRESVSARYIKEFYSSHPNSTPRDLINYIEERSSIRCSLWHQKDEMYFRQSTQIATELLRPLPNSQSEMPNFSTDAEFVRSLVASVLRKNQTHGRTTDEATHFVVKTFVSFHPADPTAVSFGTKTQAIAVAIFHNENAHTISLDGIFHANNLIEHHLSRMSEALSADFSAKADEMCLLHELILSENPKSTRNEISITCAEALQPVLGSALKVATGDEIRIWLYDPYDHKFNMLISVKRDVSDAKISKIVNLLDNHIVRKAMESQEIVSLNHIKWIKGEEETTKRYGDAINRPEKLKKLEIAKRDRSILIDSSGLSGAALAIPINRGKAQIGILEIIAAEVGSLELQIPHFRRLGKICGDVVRRLELANDRGWMVRMSFIHAARHRIEEILRDLKEEEPAAAAALLDLLQSGHRTTALDTVETIELEFANSKKRMKDRLSGYANPKEIEFWLDKFETIRDGFGLDVMACNTVADIVDTIISNSVHSDFDLKYLSLDYLESRSGSADVVIKYSPPNIMLSVERLERITVSPIPNASTPTFHYGLFLLAAQIRMLGGSAGVCWPMIDDGLGNAAFGLVFTLPTK